jgi:hypothetical protein
MSLITSGTIQKSKHPSQLMVFSLIASNGLRCPLSSTKRVPNRFKRIPNRNFGASRNSKGPSKISRPIRSCLNAGQSPVSHCKVRPEVAVREPELLAQRNVASQFSRSQSSGLFNFGVCSGQGWEVSTS